MPRICCSSPARWSPSSEAQGTPTGVSRSGLRPSVTDSGRETRGSIPQATASTQPAASCAATCAGSPAGAASSIKTTSRSCGGTAKTSPSTRMRSAPMRGIRKRPEGSERRSAWCSVETPERGIAAAGPPRRCRPKGSGSIRPASGPERTSSAGPMYVGRTGTGTVDNSAPLTSGGTPARQLASDREPTKYGVGA